MGRELRRKQAKRDGKNVREVQKKNKDKPLSPKTFVIIMCTLILFFVFLYILTGLFITKDIKWFSNNNNEDTVIEIENKILAAESLKQAEEEYYVFFYDTTAEEDLSGKLGLLSNKTYRVDLNDAFNSNFIGEPSGKVKDIKDLKVSNPTLIKVSSEKIVEFYSGKEKIEAVLK